MRLGLAAALLVWAWSAHAEPGVTYYVSPDGSDENPGTEEQPFATIQRCAAQVQPGDTCVIRGGLYRETVRPAASGMPENRITFRAADGEMVVITGADPLGDWQPHEGQIWKAPIGWDLGPGNNQIFVDWRMMNEARWPNSSLEVSYPNLAMSEEGSGQQATRAGWIADAALLPFAKDDWAGARVNIALQHDWHMITAQVTGSGGGRLALDYGGTRTSYYPTANNSYFLWGLAKLLDAPGEMFHDGGTVYLWPPEGVDLTAARVEAKRREFAFDLRDRSYISIEEIGLFAATIVTDNASEAIHLDRLRAQYVSHHLAIFSTFVTGRDNSGIVLKGRNHKLTNSEIAYSAGNGVAVFGEGHEVSNCLIHDADYAATDTAAIQTDGAGHRISDNTLYAAGRSLLVHRSTRQSQILRNRMYNAGIQMTDLGATYTYQSDGEGTEIAYNLIHDNLVREGTFHIGIYLDNGSSNHLVHHNVVWNVRQALNLNTPSRRQRVYNNTLVGLESSVGGSVVSGPPEQDVSPETVLINNIFTSRVTTKPQAEVRNNLLMTVDPKFVAPEANDFRLAADSPAIDAGEVIAPITDGYAGKAPDQGALEHGMEPFRAGATLEPGRVGAPRLLEARAERGAVRLRWGAVAGAKAHRVRYGPRRGATDFEFVTGPATSAVIATPDTTTPLWFTVNAWSDSGDSGRSNTLAAASLGGPRDAFRIIQAETPDSYKGSLPSGGVVGSNDNGDYLVYQRVNFGGGVTAFEARLAVPTQYAGQKIEIRIGGEAGRLLGTLTVQDTGGWGNMVVQETPVADVTGAQDVWLVFRGKSGVCNLDWFRFVRELREGVRIEAESFDRQLGMLALEKHLDSLDAEDWVLYQGVKFPAGSTAVELSLESTGSSEGGRIEIRLDDAGAPALAALSIEPSAAGALGTWKATFPKVQGTHDVYVVVVSGAKLGKLDWLRFGQ